MVLCSDEHLICNVYAAADMMPATQERLSNKTITQSMAHMACCMCIEERLAGLHQR